MDDQLDFILNGAETRRYHTHPVLRQQTVGAHSFGVAMIVAWIAGQKEPGIGANLLMAALTHDLAEHKMGDLPAPTKRAMPDYYGLRAPENTGIGPMESQDTFREVWNGLEEGLLQRHQLDWEHLLTPQEKKWLKAADAADGCFYCIRERAMGNKMLDKVYTTFRRYIEEFNDGGPVSELIAYIDRQREKAIGSIGNGYESGLG